MKETKELSAVIAKIIGATAQTFDDGKFQMMELGNYLSAAMSVQEGGKGVKLMKGEISKMTVADAMGVGADMAPQMAPLEPDTAAHIANFYQGLLSGAHIIFNLGKEAGKEELAQARGIDLSNID